MSDMHTVGYYSALKKKETLRCVTTWMTLREIHQSQNECCLIPLIQGNETKLIAARNRMVGAGLGEGRRAVGAGRVEFQMREVAEPRGSAARQSVCVHHAVCVAHKTPWRGWIPC